jgi:hypothetical protein
MDDQRPADDGSLTERVWISLALFAAAFLLPGIWVWEHHTYLGGGVQFALVGAAIMCLLWRVIRPARRELVVLAVIIGLLILWVGFEVDRTRQHAREINQAGEQLKKSPLSPSANPQTDLR